MLRNFKLFTKKTIYRFTLEKRRQHNILIFERFVKIFLLVLLCILHKNGLFKRLTYCAKISIIPKACEILKVKPIIFIKNKGDYDD